MKKSIVIALTCLGIIAAARILMFINALLATGLIYILPTISTVLVVLAFIGIVKGHRIAWQWGRLLGLLGAILSVLIVLASISQLGKQPNMLLSCIINGIQAVLLFIMYFALGTTGSREHFNVLCSECGKTKVKAGDFLFTKVRCPNCNKEWS